MSEISKLSDMANAIRFLSIDAVEKARSGHPGLPMGAADVAAVLFSKFMDFDPKNPDWPDRDRFILSAGHGSMLLYSLMYLLGYEDIDLNELRKFRQLGSKTAGHPEYGHARGIETTTGPLGQGIANAVGMAISERKLREEFGEALVNHRTYCLVGDGCLMEGISQEAISLAGHLKLGKLIVLWDDNQISIDGAISISDSTDQIARFEASGWKTFSVDGHDHEKIEAALSEAQDSDRPVMIACRTIIGFGAPNKTGTAGAHGAPLGKEEIKLTRKAHGWDAKPFEVPSQILDDWRIIGLKSRQKRKAWEGRMATLDAEIKGEYQRRCRGDLPAEFELRMAALKKQFTNDQPAKATRQSSQMVLEVINGVVSETIGGSADLTGSNNTKTSQTQSITPEDFSGRYLHYGIREHAMAGAMNGMALHGGLIPYSGGFMIFSDYCRTSIRLAALMEIRVIHVLTHDSIGLGEDGPTHQPVEHLASLRAIPNLNVFRPADAVETAECWQAALENKKTPSVLALSRQTLEAVRLDLMEENCCSFGAYELRPSEGDAQVSIFASGSEISIAMEVRDQLQELDIATRIVSTPCFELFEQQSEEYQNAILGSTPVNIAIEAGIRQGWDKFIGRGDIFIGMDGFGASAPAEQLYKHFGITAKNAVKQARAKIKMLDKLNKEDDSNS